MLTADLVRPRLRRRGHELQIDFLAHTAEWQQVADDLIAGLHRPQTDTLGAWQAAVDAYEGARTDYEIIRGLAKVLGDDAEFAPIFPNKDVDLDPAEIRHVLFGDGPALPAHLAPHAPGREARLRTLAAAKNVSIPQLEAILYADRPTNYAITDRGRPWTADDLIARYNLELARAALYWSDGMEVHLYDGYKDFWKFMKLFKLMFWAVPLPEGGYRVELDGPISPFVNATTRYGRQLAAFLPALFLSERWRMSATVRPPQFNRQTLTYRLDHTVPLTSHFTSSGDFDSKLEANFAAEFHEKFGDERQQWTLERESELILLGDHVMIPDFVVTHEDGRRALIEIVGFWHPNYLRRKLQQVRRAQRSDLLLLVYEGLNLTPEKLAEVPSEVLYFVRKPVLKEVMPAIERIAVRPE